MSAVTKPQRKHLAMMKHRLRYMVGRRCCAWKFDYQEWPGELVILTDADWASDSERRRSVDCVHIYHGGHLIRASTSTQQVASLSTADSEFHGIVRGAASGIQLREAFMQFGFSVRLRVLSDSSAARAMTAKDWPRRVWILRSGACSRRMRSGWCLKMQKRGAAMAPSSRSSQRLAAGQCWLLRRPTTMLWLPNDHLKSTRSSAHEYTWASVYQ